MFAFTVNFIVILNAAYFISEIVIAHDEGAAPATASKQNMFSAPANCDGPGNNISVDWNDDPVNYTCYENYSYPINKCAIPPYERDDKIPAGYQASHICLSSHIRYPVAIPTYGNHRPYWGKLGEYKFIPVQRWLHNCEHGAVVLLYHPCANPELVASFKTLVTNCLRRHIITPYTLLCPETPVCLVTWGHLACYCDYDESHAVNFIVNHALRGPEQVPADGPYNHDLIHPAVVCNGSDYNDKNLCPGYLKKN